MRKTVTLILTLSLIFFCSCSVQETMNGYIFENAVTEKSEGKIQFLQSLYNQNTANYFVSFNNNDDLLIKTESDSAGNILKISVSGKTEKSEDIFAVARTVFEIYCTDFEVSTFFDECLQIKVGSFDFEYDNYIFNCISFGGNACISVQNKKLSEVKSNELTLKVNDKSYLE